MNGFEIAMQTTFEDGRWRISVQATCRTAKACEALIAMLEVVKPLLAENDPATDIKFVDPK